MNRKEIKAQKALGTYLSKKWKERKKLRKKADKLRAKAGKLYEKGDKLYTKGDKLYINAVIEVYGLNLWS